MAAEEVTEQNLSCRDAAREPGLPKNPDLHITQLYFLLSLPNTRSDAQLHADLMEAVTPTAFLRIMSLCKHLDWQVDTDLLNRMKKANEKELKRLNELQDAEKNLGESEIRDAMMARAEHLCRVGDKEGALTTFWKTCDTTVALGHSFDIVFYLLACFTWIMILLHGTQKRLAAL